MKPQSTKIFKFRSGNENDLDALANDYLWFSKLSELNDPYEGYVRLVQDGIDDDFRIHFLKNTFSKKPKAGISPEEEVREIYFECLQRSSEAFSEHVDERSKALLHEYYLDHVANTSVFSASLAKDKHKYPSPLNSMMMWSHYANGFRGYCVEYDFEKLISSIKLENSIDIGRSKVEYALDGKLPAINLKTFMQEHDKEDKGSSLEILKAFRIKEKSWFYENEVRLLSDRNGKIKISPEVINSIYISEKTPQNIVEQISRKVKDIKLILVHLHDTDYKFGYREITHTALNK